jgi:RNA polymerase sigma-70 factor (ECF subfamily)
MQPKKQVSNAAALPTTNQQEVELLVRIADQDRSAFEALYRNYYRRLWRFLEPLTRRPNLIDEILDDTMLVVWTKAAGTRASCHRTSSNSPIRRNPS